MRFKVLAVLAAATVPLAATALPAQAAPQAKLIHVHVFKTHGKPQPTTANCTNSGATTASSYVFTGWKVAGATTARLNTATVPSYLGSTTLSSMQAGFDAWSQADAAVPKVNVVTGGTVTKPTANGSYDLMFGRTNGNSLAVTYTWRWSDGRVESDTIFGTGVTWFEASSEGDGCYESVPRYDVRNIATHEFGHTYGMDHPSGARFETMYAYGYSGETGKWSLGAGDTAGVRALY